MNEKDLVPSGLFSEEPDKGRRGFFAKLAALVAVPTVMERAYQEPEELPVITNQVMYKELAKTTTATVFDYGSCSGWGGYDPLQESLRICSPYGKRQKKRI